MKSYLIEAPLQKGVFLLVYVQPGAKKSEIIGEHNGRLKIKIAAPPVDGKANSEVIRFLSKNFGIPKSKIQLISGETNRLKKFLIPIEFNSNF